MRSSDRFIAHMHKRSHSNDSLTTDIQKVKLVATDAAHSSNKTGGMHCGGRCQHHSSPNSASGPCFTPGKTSSAVTVGGSLASGDKSNHVAGSAGETNSDVMGAGSSTASDSSAGGSSNSNMEESEEYRAGYKLGYSEGMKTGFQAGFEEARRKFCKAAEVSTNSKEHDSSAASSSSAEYKTANSSSNEVDVTGDSHNSSGSSAMSGPEVQRNHQPKQEKFRKQPSSTQEQLLAKHTTEVFHPSPTPASAAASSAAPTDCSICMTSVAEASTYQTDQDVSRDLVGCVALKLCGHQFHTRCLMQMASHDTSCLTCPNCQTIHGVRMGTQPVGGRMDIRKINHSLPGFPNSATYEIAYSFPYGVQGPEHPNPGLPYRLTGFPRVAYLPATDEGDRVLKLLRVAFDRRLIFTVGTSATSGASDSVVWNGIHHKTEARNYYGHGYPDPKYLGNVLLELASFGVTD